VAELYLKIVLSDVIITILVALLLAALLEPIYSWLTRLVPRGAAAGITVIGTLAIVFVMLSFVGTQLTSQIDEIGTPAKLAKSGGIYAQLLDLQRSKTSDIKTKKLQQFDISA
jgi:predicted PurR-regulated permease PerM